MSNGLEEYKRPTGIPILVIVAAVIAVVNLLISLNSQFYHIVHRHGSYEGLVLDSAQGEVQAIVLSLVLVFLICVALLTAWATKRTKIVSIIAIVFAVFDSLFILFMFYSYYQEYISIYIDPSFLCATILVLISNAFLIVASVSGINHSYEKGKEDAAELLRQINDLKEQLDELRGNEE